MPIGSFDLKMIIIQNASSKFTYFGFSHSFDSLPATLCVSAYVKTIGARDTRVGNVKWSITKLQHNAIDAALYHSKGKILSNLYPNFEDGIK